jgi:hypothetical protein
MADTEVVGDYEVSQFSIQPHALVTHKLVFWPVFGGIVRI